MDKGDPSPLLRHTVLTGKIGSIAKTQGPWLAIVSSDDNRLSHSGGSAKDIWDAAGEKALEQSVEENISLPAQVGSIVETAAGALPAKALLHAITLDLDTHISISIADAHTFISKLEESILALRQRHPDAPARILMPLVGTGTAKMSMSAIVGAVSRLATRLGFNGIQISLATLEGCPPLEQKFKHIEVVHSDSRDDLVLTEQSRIHSIIARMDEIVRGCAQFLNVEAPEEKGLKSVWNEFCQSSVQRGFKVPLDAETAIEQAISVRNQMVHGLAAVDGEIIDALTLGTASLVAIVKNHLAKPAKDGAQDIPTVIKQIWDPASCKALARESTHTKPLILATTGELTAKKDGSTAQTQAPKAQIQIQDNGPHTHKHEMQHVDNLVALLSALPEAETEELELLLDELQYRGERLFRIKEYCARVDPMEILRRLGATQLRKILRDKYPTDKDATAPKRSTPTDELATQILFQLGFPLPEPLEGISFAHRQVTAIRSKLPASGQNERAGLVIEASGHLESSIRNLLRFICLQVHRCGPEKHFSSLQNSPLKTIAHPNLNRLSLGTLLALLERLAKDLDNATPEERGYLDAPLTARRLAPRGFESITQLRNIFAHDRLTENSEHDLSGKAAEFLSQTLELLEFWDSDWNKSQPVYPKIIRVTTITIDSWNRRVIRATTADGIIEHIVTGMPVRAGGTYFMFPLSNPFRIDPLLIEFSATDAT